MGEKEEEYRESNGPGRSKIYDFILLMKTPTENVLSNNLHYLNWEITTLEKTQKVEQSTC